jgi:outer membrane protein OmpA-like peptidoglycan-associated protein
VTPTEVKQETAAAPAEVSVTEPAKEEKVAEVAPAAEPSATEPEATPAEKPVGFFASMEKKLNAIEPASGTQDKNSAVSETTKAEEAAPAATQEPMTCSSMSDVNKEVVHFDFDSAHLRANQKPIVAKVAGIVKACEGKVEVDGYTDGTGSSLYNQWLSEQRAESTVRGLIRQGVKRESTTAKGMGAESPIAPNDSRENRSKNRRVEFKAL